MNNKKRQPFIISRLDSSCSSLTSQEKSPPAFPEEPNPVGFRRQSSLLSKQSSFSFHDSAFKSFNSIAPTDAMLLPELLERYSQDNLQYRDEEFTQQAEAFITKIAANKKVPKELSAKFPFYQILVSISKIFMLNEYEIVVFACSLDHCNWKVDEIVLPEEADFLQEFPSNFGVEISDECKKFIMYLLVITFSLKQYLNEKSLVDKIQAYCEKICLNFQTLFNRWSKQSCFHKFNYSAPEINRKFKHLSKREYGDSSTTIKDYNMIVDNIMVLTGSYSSKTKIEAKPAVTSPNPSNQSFATQKSEVFTDLNPSSMMLDSKLFNPEPPLLPSIDQTLSRAQTLDFMNESPGVKIPNPMGGAGYSRQGSISNFFSSGGIPLMKRQNSFEFFDELNKKLLRQDSFSLANLFGSNGNNSLSSSLNQPSYKKSDSGINLGGILGKQRENDEMGNGALPLFSRQSSKIIEEPPEPLLSARSSNLPFAFENK